MKFVRDNKLLISLFIAIFLVLVIVAVFTTARYIPGMSKYTAKAYYDLPKGQLPPSTMTPQEEIKQHAKEGFIDPIYRERLREARGGVPLPTDILPGGNGLPGSADRKLAGIGPPVIPGYGVAPKDSYDLLYDPNSPYKLIGRPGRLGQEMREMILKNDSKEDMSKAEDSKPDPSVVPVRDVGAKDISPEKFKNALMNLFRVIQVAKNAGEDSSRKPVEGKLEKDSGKKAKEKSPGK